MYISQLRLGEQNCPLVNKSACFSLLTKEKAFSIPLAVLYDPHLRVVNGFYYTPAKIPRDVKFIFFPQGRKIHFFPCKPINKKKLKFEFNLKKKQFLLERAIYKRDVYKVLYTTRVAKGHLQAWYENSPRERQSNAKKNLGLRPRSYYITLPLPWTIFILRL